MNNLKLRDYYLNFDNISISRVLLEMRFRKGILILIIEVFSLNLFGEGVPFFKEALSFYPNNLDSCEHFLKKSLRYSKDSDPQIYVESLLMISTLKSIAEEFDSAGYYSSYTLDLSKKYLSKKLISPDLFGKAEANIAASLINKGDYIRARQNYETSLKRGIKLNESINIYISLANANKKIGDYDEAIRILYFLKSLWKREGELNPYLIPRTNISLAKIYLNQSLYDSAEYYNSISRQYIDNIQTPLLKLKHLGDLTWNLAFIRLGQERYQEALKVANQIDQLKPELSKLDYFLYVHHGILSRIYSKLGEIDSAFFYGESAVKEALKATIGNCHLP